MFTTIRLFKFYGWVDDRYACYEFTYAQVVAGISIVEGVIEYHPNKENVDSIFMPLEAYKIIVSESVK